MAVVQRGDRNHRRGREHLHPPPADANNRIRAVVYYIVTGNVDQEMAEETTDYPVLMARVGDNQLKFDPAAVSKTISEGDKGRNVGAPVTATGNHGTVRYTLDDSGGDDATRFEIDDKTGQITTDVDLDYEGESAATADDAGSCNGAADGAPVRECTVTVTARDSTGDAATTNATVTIMLTGVDEKPAFSTGAQTVGVPENSTDLYGADTDGYSVTDVGEVTYTAMDPEGRTVNYSLTGPDASKFQISGSTPVLSFASKPDFEAKASADRDNVYQVTVRASAGSDTGERMVRVTVGDVDEAPMIIWGGLGISGSSSVRYADDRRDAVATYTAIGPNAASARWSLEGADAGDFRISSGGVLTFRTSPDFDNPADANSDNVYVVTVKARDSENNMAERQVTVTVTGMGDTTPTPGDSLMDRYDTSPRDGELSLEEVFDGIDEYFDQTGPITLQEVNDLVDLYFDQS